MSRPRIAAKASYRPRTTTPRRAPQLLEKVEQAHAIDLYRKIGAKVYENSVHLSRGKPCPKCGTFVPADMRTGQTEGMSDLIVIFPNRGDGRRILFHEVKKPGGGEDDLRPEQRELMELLRACCEHVDHLVGDFNAAIAWAIHAGYIKAESVPHYRQPEARP